MRLRSFIASCFLALAVSGPVLADAPSSTMYSVPNITTLRGNNLGNRASVSTAGYYTPGDGGGNTYDFSSTPCTDDGGSCIHDGATPTANSFVARTIRDARQYGIIAGSQYDWVTHHTSSTDVTPVLNAMQTALIARGLNTIDLTGTTVYMKTNFSLAANFEFTCDAVVGPAANNAWYNDVPGAIYKAHGVTFNRGGSRGTSVHHCFIFPDTLVAANTPVDAQTTAAVINSMVSNGDTGLLVDGQGAHDHDLFIAGFDTCYEAKTAPENVLENTWADCPVTYFAHKIGGAPRWQNVQNLGYLTKNSPRLKLQFNIASIADNGAGLCRVTVTPADVTKEALTDLQYATYVYVAALADGPSACEGRWHITNLNTGTGTFDLVGSSVAGPTAFCHWAARSFVIYCSNVANINNGESITCCSANGIANPTKVMSKWELPPNPNGYLTDTGPSANTYVAIAPSAVQPCDLTEPRNVSFTPGHTSTGASTLNITLNSASGCTGGTTGPIAIVHEDNTALIANDLIAAVPANVVYNATFTHWVLMQPKVTLQTATTLAQAANVAVTFAGATCSGGPCGVAPVADVNFAARVDAGGSAGGVAAGGTGFATGFLVGGPIPQELPNTDRVAGFQCLFCADFDHSIGTHTENSNETSFVDFANDSIGPTDDQDSILHLVDGRSNNVHFMGRTAAKGGRAIVVNIIYPNNADRGAVTWTASAVAATVAFRPVIDVEQGTLQMTAGVSNAGGTGLVSHFATGVGIINSYLPNVQMYYEDAAAKAITCTIGTKLLGGDTCQSATSTWMTGLAPVVSVSDYGAVGDGATDDSPAFSAAIAAAQAKGINTVYVTKTGPYYLATGASIPSNITLKCMSSRTDQVEDGGGNPTGDHKSYPYALLIPTGQTLTAGHSAGTDGCNLIHYETYASPNPTTLQTLYNVVGSGTNAGTIAGTGFTCGGDGCFFKRGVILGFLNGYVASGHDSPQLEEAYIDAPNCIALTNSGFVEGQFHNWGCYSLLSNRLSYGLQNLPIDAVAASPSTPANYRFHLSAPCADASGNCPRDGNIVWIGPFDNTARPVGVESFAGKCTYHRIDDSDGECTDSQTAATVTTGTTVANQTMLCGIGNVTHVRQNQAVTGTNIAGFTTVADATGLREGCVVLSLPMTGSGAIANLQFADNAFSGANLYSLRPFANNRDGIALNLTSVNNFKFSNCEMFTHTTFVKFNNSTQFNTFSNCAMEDERNDLDSSHVGLDFEAGSAANYWNGGAIHIGGNLGTAILSNQSGGTPLNANRVTSVDTGSSLWQDRSLDMEAGNLIYEASPGPSSQGSVFVGDSTRHLIVIASFATGTKLYYQSQTGAAVTCVVTQNFNSSNQPAQCPLVGQSALTALVGGGQAGATLITNDFARFNGVASDHDSGMLPVASKGTVVLVVNSATHILDIYGNIATSDQINNNATGTPLSIPGRTGTTNSVVLFLATGNGLWQATPVYTATSINGVTCTFGTNCIVGPYLIAQLYANASAPADTTEDTLATIAVPANSLLANGCLDVDLLWTVTASTNNKTLKIYLGTTGTTAYASPVVSAVGVAAVRTMTHICNANATNAQVGGMSTGGFGTTGTVAPLTTGAVDTTSSANLIITGQKASAGEVLTLVDYSVRVSPHS